MDCPGNAFLVSIRRISFQGSVIANYVCRIQSLGALLAFEFNCFAFIQCLVSGVLDRREMNEHILSRRTLDKPVPFCSVEPLHYAMFFHIHSFADLPIVRLQNIPKDTDSRLSPTLK